jgi:hypothetical protein
VGRLGFDVYLDAFPFQTFSRGFINRSFILNPTLATTGTGAIGGVAAEDAIGAGVEFTHRLDQTWTIGASWAKPTRETFGPGLDDEKVLETSYKFQLSKNSSLMPDVQLVFDPADNPGESSIWVVGIRAMFVL